MVLDFGLSLIASALPALLLWAFLPRGVVLTRSRRKVDWKDNPVDDTWEVKNNSAMPVTILSVTTSNPGVDDVEVDAESDDDSAGVSLMLDDWDQVRDEWHAGGWRGVTLLPGETLTARVTTNTVLRIKYRRSGMTGALERRQLIIIGYA